MEKWKHLVTQPPEAILVPVRIQTPISIMNGSPTTWHVWQTIDESDSSPVIGRKWYTRLTVFAGDGTGGIILAQRLHT